jgi:FkbM family methyltransferase
MKNKTTIKEGGWVWPAIDVRSWNGQNEYINLVDCLLPFVKSKDVMLQAGGNCGLILSTFVKHFNVVYTFEPDPVNFYCLCQNVTEPNVIKMQACLGNENKTLQVSHLARESGRTDIGGVHVTGDGFIPQITIDSLNLPSCGLIQLDIEGFELKALEGAINTIQKYKPVVCVEMFEPWLNRYNNTRSDISDFFEQLDYTCVGTEGVDSIFIHKNHTV